ncbi:MAG TPA: hypothetical protein EYN06_03165 [Myxococcales bacterium]|nr:hypothetical protein [Myxococcales bacterium]
MVLLPHSDIYVVSDLHLGEGWQENKQRYSRLETFFYDNEFRNFIHAILYKQSERSKPCTLVLNGDIFDFLSVVRVPNAEESRKWGLRISRSEQKFGLDTRAAKAEWKMARILRGHRNFVVALAELLAAGNAVVVVRGNHDLELHWDVVQQRFMNEVAKIAEEEGFVSRGETLLPNIAFRQWFYYEKNRFYIEHGNQYEATNAVRFVLNPVLPLERRQVGGGTLDYPMGSLFVRYLYNKLKLLDPFSTHFVTLAQYIRLTYSHNLLDLVRTGVFHFPFFLRAIKDARVFEKQGMQSIQAKHEANMQSLGRESGLGDKLAQIEQLMSRPAGTTKPALLKEMLKPALRAALFFLAVALTFVCTWFLLFATIQQADVLSGSLLADVGKSVLTGILVLTTLLFLFLSFSFLKRGLHRKKDPTVSDCFSRAESIAELLDVPFVSMGHTHTADHRLFSRRNGCYINTGTWIPHPGPWDTIKSNARQFTFARLADNDMELLRWDDATRCWEAVTLLEDYTPSALERLLADPDRSEGSSGADDV